MTKNELIKALAPYDDEDIVVCMDDKGGWDNIQDVYKKVTTIRIVFGGGSPFSDE